MAGTVEVVDKDGNALGTASAPFVTNASAVSASSVPTDGAVTVNATTTQLLAANPNRQSGLIKNTGTQTVYVKQNTAATTSGFPLSPGDALTIRHQLAVNGTVSSGTGTCFVIEEAR